MREYYGFIDALRDLGVKELSPNVFDEALKLKEKFESARVVDEVLKLKEKFE